MSHSDRDFLKASATLADPFYGPGVTDNMRLVVADCLIVIPRASLPATSYFDESLSEDGVSVRMDLRLQELIYNGTTVTSFVVRWLANNTTYTFTDVQSTMLMGGYNVVEMRLVLDDVIATAVLIFRHQAEEELTFTWSPPADEVFISRRVEIDPYGVTEIQVNGIEVNSEGQSMTDPPQSVDYEAVPVNFRGGFNINLETDADPQLAPVDLVEDASERRLIFNVDARGGEGRFPSCEAGVDDRVITAVNGVKPDDYGNLRIATDACFRLERAVGFGEDPPPETNPRLGMITEGHLSISNGCRCCSPCEDYATLYKLVRTLFLRLVNMHTRLGTAIDQYEHLGRLLDKVRDYVEKPKVNVRVVQNSQNIFTIQVAVQTGESAFDQVEFDVDWPEDFTVEYLTNSGWIKMPGTRPRQINDLFSTDAGAEWTHEQTLPKFSVCWFNWTVKFVPDPDPGGTSTVTATTVEINPTVSLRRLEPNATAVVVPFGPLQRRFTITYPTLPSAYGPSRQP